MNRIYRTGASPLRALILRRGVLSVMVVAGVLLLCVNLYGLLADPGLIDPARKSGKPGKHYPAIPIDQLLEFRMIDHRRPDFAFVAESNDLVFSSIMHPRKHRSLTFSENWLVWVMARLLYAPLSYTQQTDRIIAGRTGWCGQVAQVVKAIMEDAGARARFVGLAGHVVLEVEVENGWVVADPDYGVSYPVAIDALERPENEWMLRKALGEGGYTDAVTNKYVRIFQTREDNTTLPVGSALSPRLNMVEIASEWLKWIIPLMLVLVSLGFYRYFQS